MTDTIRVFVNAVPVDVPRGATAVECVRAWRSEEADAVDTGKRTITDSRGLPITAASVAAAGSIYRTIPTRAKAERGE